MADAGVRKNGQAAPAAATGTTVAAERQSPPNKHFSNSAKPKQRKPER
jgi:hypothetical protein